MSSDTRIFIVNNIKLPVDASSQEAFSVALGRLAKASVNATYEDCKIYRRSVDARRRDNIHFVYSVAVNAKATYTKNALLGKLGITIAEEERLVPQIGSEPMSAPPVIIGTGPCGLFCALLLAEYGYRPILVERGGSVKERVAAVDKFVREHILDTETNIQFGAGGAGTFSDGKLITRINDPISGYVLSRLVDFGAPEEILYLAKPHIGTDILSRVVENILNRIEALGGAVLYHTRFELPRVSAGGCAVAAVTNKGDIPAGAIVLALGHSARDTYKNLMNCGFSLEAKSFSVGMRIEHLCTDIDKSMYGDMAGHPKLGHAEYSLSHNTKERGVYTFCMCPGGEVVAAASEELGTVVNGMSHHSRDGKNSNSAVCCTVFREDYGATPELAIEYQRKIERSAYLAGNGNYTAPIITVGDFLAGTLKHEPRRVTPTYMKGENVKLANPEAYLPKIVTESIKGALCAFDKKLSGFAASDAVLTGVETRTSSPIRILRNAETRVAFGFGNIYPAGEGAGYAGGITSAAVDGVRTALAIMKKYKP